MSGKTPKLDADQLLGRLCELQRSVHRSVKSQEVEIYHRATISVRLGRRADGEAMTTRVGHEEGVAVRTRSSGDGTMGFAACSGADAASVRWALEQAERAPGAGSNASWVGPGQGTAIDHDEMKSLPSVEALEIWLRDAWEHLLPTGVRRARAEPVEAWVEAARTVESWATDAPWQGTRSRVRAWALASLSRSGDNPGVLRPAIVASRCWATLEPRAWHDVLSDRLLDSGHGSAGSKSVGRARLPVLFNPESSATLVVALVKSLHLRQEPRSSSLVGPGLELADMPQDKDAIFGGIFDDAGFPTQPTSLADGHRVTGFLSGHGHLRRPSFRDPPIPQHSQIVVSTEGGMLPAKPVLMVSALGVHPLGLEDWGLEVEGALLEGGQPRQALHGFIRTSPSELAGRCLGAIGPARQSHLGVRTPGLLFDELEVLL